MNDSGSTKKIDISSTAIEKGIDVAKDFLDKLIIPAVEETGLLIKDFISLWRFKNQIKMLSKAKLYCEDNNINPKQISLKLLCPILDYASVEEDEVLQDKWSVLLSNLVAPEQNIENHVFPYILSQLSSHEYTVLESVFDQKEKETELLTKELEDFKLNRLRLDEEITEKIVNLDVEIKNIRNQTTENSAPSDLIWELISEKQKCQAELNKNNYKISNIKRRIKKHKNIPDGIFEEFEMSNLVRLGLAKEVKHFFANRQTLDIPDDEDGYRSIDVDIDIQSKTENILTELGQLFFSACKLKSNRLRSS